MCWPSFPYITFCYLQIYVKDTYRYHINVKRQLVFCKRYYTPYCDSWFPLANARSLNMLNDSTLKQSRVLRTVKVLACCWSILPGTGWGLRETIIELRKYTKYEIRTKSHKDKQSEAFSEVGNTQWNLKKPLRCYGQRSLLMITEYIYFVSFSKFISFRKPIVSLNC